MTATPALESTDAVSQLSVRAVRKSFSGVEVLRGVDLDARSGRVLALLGENGAGKSTLMKIIAGDYQPDAGELRIGEHTATSLTPVSARALGIRMIYQEFSDAPDLTVAENIVLGRWPARAGRVDWAAVRAQAGQVLADLDAQVDPAARVADLRVGERQIVEIARAVSDDARCLILDEPTAALSAEEVERLFAIVRRLRTHGTAMIYITHRLDELRQIADDVLVLRDGQVALCGPVAAFDRSALVSAMIGRSAAEVGRPGPSAARTDRPDVLRYTAAGSRGVFTGVDVAVRAGEVVALYGKLGSGTAEVAEAAFGLRPLDAGTLEVDGTAVVLDGPPAAIRAGVGFLPADRQRDGAFLVRPIAENVAAPSWPWMARLRVLVSARQEAVAFARWRQALRIRSTDDPGQQMGTLSGGNQQKALLARWLERRSKVFVLVEPTRGVDVGARADIYATVRALAAQQALGVLIATSDYEEVVQLADRALVMSRGRVVRELVGAQITTVALTEAAGG